MVREGSQERCQAARGKAECAAKVECEGRLPDPQAETQQEEVTAESAGKVLLPRSGS